jgi:hypothetical protein
MIISVTKLASSSEDEKARSKFILLEDGTLLFGRCMYHKDLYSAFCNDDTKKEQEVIVLAAGTVPDDVNISLEDERWGGWKSTGYNVITPLYLRKSIQDAFISFLQVYI